MSECNHTWYNELDPFCIKCYNYKISLSATTGRVMCQKISDYHFNKTGIRLDPLTMWEYSKTGELSQIGLTYRAIMIEEFNRI